MIRTLCLGLIGWCLLLAFGSGGVTSGETAGTLLSQLAAQTEAIGQPQPAQLGAQQVLGGAQALTARPPTNWSTWLLWATLLAGVLLLAWMAWRLYQQLERPKTP